MNACELSYNGMALHHYWSIQLLSQRFPDVSASFFIPVLQASLHFLPLLLLLNILLASFHHFNLFSSSPYIVCFSICFPHPMTFRSYSQDSSFLFFPQGICFFYKKRLKSIFTSPLPLSPSSNFTRSCHLQRWGHDLPYLGFLGRRTRSVHWETENFRHLPKKVYDAHPLTKSFLDAGVHNQKNTMELIS